MSQSNSRSVRIFLSSTFRDFGEERDLLVRRVFPSLRARLKDRFVDLVDIDLRWGITVEQAERGEVLPICLAEIDRARPYFVGMLGERYGWIPPRDAYELTLLERQKWLEDHRGGCSVTELEILHGVLNNPDMAGRAFFYFRDPAYSATKGGDYVAASAEDARRQRALKDRIRESGFPIVENYATPENFAERLEADLWNVLDEIFPADEFPDAFERESIKHEAYAAPRRRLYLGGGRYVSLLDNLLANGCQRILIEGESGGGKSALIANWVDAHTKDYPNDLIHIHYIGASADTAAPWSVVRRVCEAIKRKTGSKEEIPSDPQKLMDCLSLWLANASAYASKENKRWLVVLDALNGLSDLRDLRWFPEFLPERVHLVVSCLSGDMLERLRQKGEWTTIKIKPLTSADQWKLLKAYLGRYNKTLPEALETRIFRHSLAVNPLFLRTLAEELRLFGSHEELERRLDYYLTSATVDDLFEKVLERVESDCGPRAVRETMEAIWGSRAGLREQEVLGIANLVPATWAPIRHALDEALLEIGGRITFAHDYMRIAISDRYLEGNGALSRDGQSQKAIEARCKLHTRLAEWFEQKWKKKEEDDQGAIAGSREQSGARVIIDAARAAEEIPHQWREALNWERLREVLTTLEMYKALDVYRSPQEILHYWLDLEARLFGNLEQHYEQAWSKWSLDETTLETCDLASGLGLLLERAGRYSAFSLKLAQLTLDIDLKINGEGHLSTVWALQNLGRLLSARGEYSNAELFLSRAVAVVEMLQGADHKDTASCISSLADLFCARADYAAAEPLYRRALAIAKKAQGPEHADTGTSLNNLALLLQAKGEYAAAEPLHRRALAIAEKAQGPEHPETGTRLNNLAGLLEAQGDYAGAEPLYRRALAIREKAQGPEHPSTGTALDNLAMLLKAQGDYAAAEPLLRRALAIAEKAEGSEHPSTGRTLNNLAVLLEAQGDYAVAEPLYRRALAIAEKAQGPEHPDTGTRLNNLAGLLEAQGDYAGAEPLYRRALAIAEKVEGSEHPSTGTRLNNLAGLLQAQGDYAGAEPLYRRALAIAEKAQGPEHPSTGTSLNNLAGLLVETGAFEDAEKMYRRSLAIVEKSHAPNHPIIRTSLANLSKLLFDQGNSEEAELLTRRALSLKTGSLRVSLKQTAELYERLALILALNEEFDDAIIFQKKRIKTHKLTQNNDQAQIAIDIASLAAMYENKGDAPRALWHYKKALKLLNPEHKDYQAIASDIFALKNSIKRER
jgi:nephrocystin-3